ncbi:MAG: GIY-YIG nuclease family protein [Candidatus Melainabacteria bacterium]|nr:GIY-YIG nuclease family protein [Candidatus Melainabacteria bacterium]
MSSSISAETDRSVSTDAAFVENQVACNDGASMLVRESGFDSDSFVERKVSFVDNGSLSDYGSLLDYDCLFVDCQTTGASPSSGGNLLEVAWCNGNASNSIASDIVSHLIAQPDGEPIPFRIQSLTGITDDAMVDAISRLDLVEKLLANDNSLSAPRLCVIHYARFETPFLNLLVEEHTEKEAWPYQLICTFEIARRLYPNLPSRGIRALGGFLGIDMEECKRSTSHVDATRVIWKHLVEKLSQVGVTTVDQLQEFLAAKAERRTGKLDYPLERLKRLELPNCPGVYRMLSQNGRVLYVGKATSLKSRVNSHFRGRKNKTSKSKELLTQVANIEVTECGSPLEAALLETDEIKKFDPPYNVSLKQRSRSLLFASRDFLSFNDTQDELHVVGPMPNPRALDALLRLNATINDGIVDPLILFEELPMEDLVEGIDIFLDRNGIDAQEGMTPRILLALGLRLFRSARRALRQLAMEQAIAMFLAKANGIDLVGGTLPFNDVAGLQAAISTAETMAPSGFAGDDFEQDRLAEIGRSLVETEEFDESVFEESDDLTPEEIADRLDSLLIGIARTYLVSKEMTSLLNATIRFEYKSRSRDLVIRHGKLALGTSMVSESESSEPELSKSRSKKSKSSKSESSKTKSSKSNVDVLINNDVEGSSEILQQVSNQLIDHAVSGRGRNNWFNLDVCDYDRMRVLLTEIMRMKTAGAKVEVFPPLSVLSRW